MMIREQLELREIEILSPYASFSRESRGRERKEEECDIRPVFQRDRDRVLASARRFGRLKAEDKQVGSSALRGDHYQDPAHPYAGGLARMQERLPRRCSLNEDLVEAIALGHDLGHTPFRTCRRAGIESSLCDWASHHHEQSVRVVEVLEKQGKGTEPHLGSAGWYP